MGRQGHPHDSDIQSTKQPFGTKAKTSGNNWVFLPIGFDGGQNYPGFQFIKFPNLIYSSLSDPDLMNSDF